MFIQQTFYLLTRGTVRLKAAFRFSGCAGSSLITHFRPRKGVVRCRVICFIFPLCIVKLYFASIHLVVFLESGRIQRENPGMDRDHDGYIFLS